MGACFRELFREDGAGHWVPERCDAGALLPADLPGGRYRLL
jgi:hypothetical protein